MKNITGKYKHAFIHIIVWVLFLMINGIHIYVNNGKITIPFLVLLGSNIVIFYINYLYLVPRLLLRKKLSLYLVFVLLLVTAPTAFFRLGIVQTRIAQNAPPEAMFNRNPNEKILFLRPGADQNTVEKRVVILDSTNIHPNNAVGVVPARRMIVSPPFLFYTPIIINIAFLVVGTSVRVYSEWNKNEINKKEIEQQKAKAELHFLKNQLSPHFLFNSLNSIYSLSRKKSDNTPEAIITLSELMRHMLYQANNDFVLLKDELDYIQNFIKLQRLRIANNEKVSLNIHGTVSKQKIRPLLLISFIENAFKYGTDFKGNTEVMIKIYILDKNLHFECKNLIGSKNSNTINSGIGLKNTKDRLDLLYPGKYDLQIKEVENFFVVKLKLELD